LDAGIALREPQPLGALVERFGGSADAAAQARQVSRLVTPDDASGADDLILLTSVRHSARAGAAAGVVLCSTEAFTRLAPGRRWRHEHPLWVVAELLDEVAARREVRRPERAPDALIEPAEIGSGTQIMPGAVVLSGARIGQRCSIGPNAVIHAGAVLGDGVTIGAGSVIGRPGFGWTPRPDGTLRRIPHLAGVMIEDDVEIGPLCTIDAGTLRATRIGAKTKLDAHVHVAHNVRIGRGCLIAAQTGFAGSAVLEDAVMVGGQVGVTDHARVGAGARLAAKSGVIGDIAPGSTVAGFPAIPRWRWLRAMARR
jgi:UDP-3-O-[3-hydroxymyristoyl] glucosamine N-acyltransferase